MSENEEKKNAMDKIKKMLNDVLGEMEERMPEEMASELAEKMEKIKHSAEKARSDMFHKSSSNYYVVFTGINKKGERVFDNMYFRTPLKIFEGSGKGLQALSGKVGEENLLKDIVVLNVIKMDDEVVDFDD